MGNPIITPEQLSSALVTPMDEEDEGEGVDDQLRTVVSEQPEQTAAMLKIWLEEANEPEPEPAQ